VYNKETKKLCLADVADPLSSNVQETCVEKNIAMRTWHDRSEICGDWQR
jgi:hypothetical protein